MQAQVGQPLVVLSSFLFSPLMSFLESWVTPALGVLAVTLCVQLARKSLSSSNTPLPPGPSGVPLLGVSPLLSPTPNSQPNDPTRTYWICPQKRNGRPSLNGVANMVCACSQLLQANLMFSLGGLVSVNLMVRHLWWRHDISQH